MQVVVDNFEEAMKNLDELLYKIHETEEAAKNLKFYNIKEFSKIIGWSEKKVSELYRRPDFPSCDFGKEKVAEINAIRKYFSIPRRK